MNDRYFEDFIQFALNEDIADGDHTSLACIPAGSTGKAELIVKQEGIIAGVEITGKILQRIDDKLEYNVFIKDGEKILPGDIVFSISGKVHSILKAERLILNILQRMSGIATSTNNYVSRISGYKTKILDTRKTTPGFRYFEKEAVRIGGGVNHRMGLYDMIMIKDNHIDFAGGISKAINKVKEYLEKNKLNLKIEVEARDLNEVKEILLTGKVDRIMLDNFTPQETIEAIKLINGRVETESSGGITLDTIRDYAACGVDYISVGALTHHIKSLDLSLKAVF
ncbi:MAG: carboxylating nicotinate-nucleotide diphosphorylase [Marinilabiliales bacterium]